MKKHAVVGVAILLAVGCKDWPGIPEIPGFPSGTGGSVGVGGNGSGTAGHSGSGGGGMGGTGVPPGCGAGQCDGAACECGGFVMPNPASSGLPTPAMYDVTIPGIVTDKITGLQWELADGDRTPTAGCTDSVRCASRLDAENFCASLRLGGFDDWRLPSVIELVSLVDFTASPAVAPDVFLDAPASNPYWTTSEWEVSLSTGVTVNSDVPVPPPVRCVRRAAPSRCWPAGARYQATTGNQVTDLATGLVWEQRVSSPPVTWDDAQTHCASLGSGFRAPTVKELQTIAIFEGSSRIDTVAFPDTPLAHYWTSHLRLSDPTYGWSVKFNTGGGGTEGLYFAGSRDVTTTLLPVRCVR